MKKPLIQPRNIQVRPNKTGQGNSSYFSPLVSLACSTVSNPYVDIGRRLLKEQHDSFVMGNNHESVYKPASGKKSLY
jgi:hypothetical protein